MKTPPKQKGKKQAEVLFQKVYEERNNILERIADGFIALDKNWCFTYINKKAGQIFQCSPQQMIGKHIWTEFPESINQPFYNAYYQAMAEQTCVYLEEYHTPYDLWFENHIYPSPNGLSIYFRDITKQKKTEAELTKAYKENETVLNRISDSVVSVDNEWRYTFLNDAALATHPRGKQETLGKVIWEVHPEMEGTVFWDKYHEAMETRKVVEIESYYAPMNAWFFVKVYPSSDGLTIFYRDITGRKKAEEELDQSRNRFRVLIENMSDAIVLSDEHSNLLYQSPSVTRILGYTWEERKGKPILDYIHPDSQNDLIVLYKMLHEHAAQPFPFQYRFLHKKGHYVWLEGVVTNLLHEASVKAIVANYRDISDRKEAEEKLLRERSLLRTLIDNLPDYIYVKDTESRYLINNMANVKLMGSATEEETIGKSAADIFSPEIARAYHEDDQIVFQSGVSILDRQETTSSSTGEPKFLLTTKVPLKDSHDNVIGLVGISRDITKQKQVELDLRNSNYFLELAQHVGKIGHWISEIGETSKITWSAETCRIFGLKPEEFDGRPETFFSFVHPEDLDGINSATAIAIENNQAHSIDHRIVLRDGTLKWVKTTFDKHGKAARLVGTAQDITERKQAENEILELNAILEDRVKLRTEQLQGANKEMEAFTYSVSHDLRSPLRIIDGYAQILVEDYTSKLDKEGQETLGVIMSNTRKMGQLIDDLLNFSRIGRAEIKKTNVNMNGLVNECIQELQLSGVVIPTQLRIEPLKPARCDANLLKNVWINLLSNGIKYSSAVARPEIEVGMQKNVDKSIYYVKDNGAGFDMQYYHKLFGVFQRLHSHHEFSGTGVGLAIVQRIIVRHGGLVWAESKVNEGTTFYFSLD